jgi:hypothetical protein
MRILAVDALSYIRFIQEIMSSSLPLPMCSTQDVASTHALTQKRKLLSTGDRVGPSLFFLCCERRMYERERESRIMTRSQWQRIEFMFVLLLPWSSSPAPLCWRAPVNDRWGEAPLYWRGSMNESPFSQAQAACFLLLSLTAFRFPFTALRFPMNRYYIRNNTFIRN